MKISRRTLLERCILSRKEPSLENTFTALDFEGLSAGAEPPIGSGGV